MQTAVHEYNNTKLKNMRANDIRTDKGNARNFCAPIDNETAYMLDEIRSKYSGETNASIIAKAIRYLHDQACRSLADSY